MQRGLEGRRIAVFAAPEADAAIVRRELVAAGAVVNDLPALNSAGDDERWHGGMYAGLVLVGGTRHPRIAQLIREFMASEKPVAAMGLDTSALGLDDSPMTVRGDTDEQEFARAVVREFSGRLEESAVDEMSDMSFPASDPPAMNPGTAGHMSQDRDRSA